MLSKAEALALCRAEHGDPFAVLGLHPEEARQTIDDPKFIQLEETAHHGRDIARIADGYEDAEVFHVPVALLGDLKGEAFLP